MGIFNKKKNMKTVSNNDMGIEEQTIIQQKDNKDIVRQDKTKNIVVFDEFAGNAENNNSMDELDEATLMSKDLMVYIGEAITKWSKQYGMEQMPPNLVFKKALTLMTAWDRNSVFK